MNNKVELNMDRLVLRTLQVEDITKEYIDGLNDPDVNEFLVNVRLKKQTKESVADFISHNLDSETDILLGIFTRDNSEFIGTIRIGDISSFHHFCSVGICLFNRHSWGKGFAVEALNRAVEFIFNELNLHYIEAGVYSENVASMKLFKRAGFIEQAVFNEKYRHVDTFKKVVMYGKVNRDFNYEYLQD